MRTVKLSNGVEMPLLGFGVFQVPNLAQCEKAVSEALSAGYRLIDTAKVYANEEAVGAAIRKSKIPREELFITTKAYIHDMGYENTKKAFEASLIKLGVDYLDLYLIHQPFGDYYASWRAMEEFYKAGKVRAIGVSNFLPDRLMDICYNAAVTPMVNQVEMHPLFQQGEALQIMEEFNVKPQAWAPFAEGKLNIFSNEVLTDIGKQYGKTVAQVMLRWNTQRGVSVIPKSVHKERIEENFTIWDFELTQKDMELIAQIDTGHGLILDTLLPSEVKRLYNIQS